MQKPNSPNSWKVNIHSSVLLPVYFCIFSLEVYVLPLFPFIKHDKVDVILFPQLVLFIQRREGLQLVYITVFIATQYHNLYTPKL